MVPNYSLSLSRAVWLLSVMLGLLPLLWVTVSEGQTTSITSSGLGTTITSGSIDPAGRPNYIITGGTRPGDGPNLFHSFGDFSVGTNNVARFFNETGRSTTNILSRVTGGQTSNIYGTIQTAGFGTAALWLINPAGIVFGPSASLNVGGSVHFSTADYLRLGSGNDRFYADLGKTSQLTSAPATAFGFLAEGVKGPITVQAGNPIAVAEGKAISLIGGDISITGRTLSAPGGQINVASMASGAEVLLNPGGQFPGLKIIPLSQAGQTLQQLQTAPAEGTVLIRGGELVGAVTLGNNAVLKTDATPGGKAGSIDIEASQLDMSSGATISASTQGASNAENITITATDRVTISDATIFNGLFGENANVTVTSPHLSLDNGSIQTFTNASGKGGDITMRGADVTLTNGSSIVTVTQEGTGKAGDISITATDQVSLSGATILSATVGSGKSGDVAISSGDVRLMDGSSIETSTRGKDASGNSGNVTISSGDIRLTGGSSIETFAQEGTGKAGDILIAATNQLNMLSGGVIRSQSGGDGDTGNLTITSRDISLSDSAHVTTDSYFAGKNGNISIDAVTLTMNGAYIASTSSGEGTAGGGNISIHASNSVNMTNAQIGSGAQISQNANTGDVEIMSPHITLTSSSVSTASLSAGNTGDVTIRSGETGDITFTLSTLHTFVASNGEAGNIVLETGTLKMNPSTQIAASTGGAGNAGNISITASDHITLSGNADSGVSVTNSTSAAGNAGSITINTNHLATDFAGISSSSEGMATAGSAGQITIQGRNGAGSSAQGVDLSNSTIRTTINGGTSTSSPASIAVRAQSVSLAASTINAATGGPAPAGNIDIDAAKLTMNPGTVISASTSGTGHAGNIAITASDVAISGSGAKLGTETSSTGNAGSVTINANQLTITNGGQISSSSTGSVGTVTTPGKAGSVTLTAVNQFQANAATVSSSAADGQGGAITIQGGNIAIANGSLVSTSTTGPNDAGNILLTPGSNIFLTNSTVSTSATKASGGNIDLTAPNLVRLVGANLTSSVAGPSGSNGGNITIDTAHPQFVIMQGNSQILAKANEGQGGAITIIGGVVLQEPGSVLDATAGPAGISGSINIQAPFQQLSGAIAPLPQAFAVATNLYGQRCAAEKGGQFSSFVQGSRDGVPPQPGDLIPSPLMLELDEVPLSSSLQSSSSLSAIRLGLPQFEQLSRSSLTVFAGCRS